MGQEPEQASSQQATGAAGPTGDGGLGTLSSAGLAPATAAPPQTAKLLTAP